MYTNRKYSAMSSTQCNIKAKFSILKKGAIQKKTVKSSLLPVNLAAEFLFKKVEEKSYIKLISKFIQVVSLDRKAMFGVVVYCKSGSDKVSGAVTYKSVLNL